MAAGRQGRGLDLAGAALVAAQLGVAAVLVPTGNSLAWPGGTPLGGACLSRALFHVDCPFCGMTRSFVALAHGDVGAAIDFHPAGPLLFVAMLGFLGAVIAVAVRRAQPLFERRRVVVAIEAIALLCVAIGTFKMVRS